jgi:nucleotide-binding universal stress UspA family protein
MGSQAFLTARGPRQPRPRPLRAARAPVTVAPHAACIPTAGVRTYSKILVATDFSDGARQALDEALALAARLGARVTVAHAYSPPITDGPHGLPPRTAWLDELERAVDRDLRALADEYAARGVTFETRRVLGNADTLAALAASEGFDLLVAGTHGRSGLGRLLIGSFAERLARRSRVPVLTIREERGHAPEATAAP